MKHKTLIKGGLWRYLVLWVLVCLNIHCSPKNQAWTDPEGPADFSIRIEAEQFVWNIIYPGPDGRWNTSDDIHAQNQVVLPVGAKVLVELHSKDVVHGFWIPSLGIRQTIIPGPVLVKQLVVQEEGKFRLACSELCGVGHSKMVGWLHVLSGPDYQKWLTHTEKPKNLSSLQ